MNIHSKKLLKWVSNYLPYKWFGALKWYYQFKVKLYTYTASYKSAISKDDIIAYNLNRVLGPRRKICYAPFNSLYFGLDGNVSACCYNRYYKLGNIQFQLIENIWNGTNAENLRNAITSNDLSLGCGICETQFVSKDYSGVMAAQYDWEAQEQAKFPTRMDFELSNVCNLECIMCNGNFSSSIRKNVEKLPPIQLLYNDDFLKNLKDYIPHLKIANFLGGEPFLIDIYYEIWQMIIEVNPNCAIRVQTNATIYNQKIQKILAKGNFNIAISIDSLQENTYNNIRQNAQYNHVMKNITSFLAYTQDKQTFLTISFSPMKNNWKEMPDVIRFCNENSAMIYFNMVLSPIHLSLWSLTSEEMKEIITYLKAAKDTFQIKNFIHRKNLDKYQDYIQLLERWLLEISNRELKQVTFLQENVEVLQNTFSIQMKNIIDSDTFINVSEKQDILDKLLYNVEEFLGKQDAHLQKLIMIKLITAPWQYGNTSTQNFADKSMIVKLKPYLLYEMA